MKKFFLIVVIVLSCSSSCGSTEEPYYDGCQWMCNACNTWADECKLPKTDFESCRIEAYKKLTEDQCIAIGEFFMNLHNDSIWEDDPPSSEFCIEVRDPPNYYPFGE